MQAFWTTFSQTLFRPHRAIAAIAAAPSARQGFAATALFGSLYSLAALTSYAKGRRPQGRLLTFIPAERYYLAESVFCLPLTLVWMTLFAGMTRRLAARVGGGGTFEGDLAILGFTWTVPMIALFWLPDEACYLLGVPEDRYLRLVPVYGSAAMAWTFVLTTAGIAAAERIPWRRALPVVVTAEAASAVASGVAVAMR